MTLKYFNHDLLQSLKITNLYQIFFICQFLWIAMKFQKALHLKL
jgi:hypothetical protein